MEEVGGARRTRSLQSRKAWQAEDEAEDEVASLSLGPQQGPRRTGRTQCGCFFTYPCCSCRSSLCCCLLIKKYEPWPRLPFQLLLRTSLALLVRLVAGTVNLNFMLTGRNVLLVGAALHVPGSSVQQMAAPICGPWQKAAAKRSGKAESRQGAPTWLHKRQHSTYITRR